MPRQAPRPAPRHRATTARKQRPGKSSKFSDVTWRGEHMRTVQELAADLSRRGVMLWADGDELRVRAPKNALTDELRTALRENKTELLTIVRERAADRPAAIPKIVPDPEKLHE